MKNSAQSMKKKRLGTVDLDTGEILNGSVAYCAPKQNPYQNGFVMLSQEEVARLLQEGLSRHELLVLLALITRASWENEINVGSKILAKLTGLQTGNVSVAVRGLEERQIVTRIGTETNPRAYVFRLSHELLWKGKTRRLADRRVSE